MADPERKPVPEIPGVMRGENFFKDKPLEMAGQELASRRRKDFGEMPLDLYVIKLIQAGYMSLPFLGREDNDKSAELWEPRVDPRDGSVITWRWENQKADRYDYSDCVAFAGKRLNSSFNYNHIPQGWTISRLIPQKIKEGLEAAMRQQDEIAHDYGKDVGPEKARVDETFDLLYETSSAFAMGEVNSQGDLNTLAKLAEEHFTAHGLLDSEDSIWQRVVTHTLRSVDRDSRQRINPLISRVRARAAFLAGTEREMVARSVGSKAEKVYSHLALIRAGIRLRIQMAIDSLDDICGFSKGKFAQDPVMFEHSQTSTARQGWELEQDLKVISNDVLRKIQPAPYLFTVTVARIILMGETAFRNNEEKEAALEIIKGSNYYKFLGDSAVRWLREKRPLVAKTRMRLAHDLLRQGLNDQRTTDIKVFD